MLDEQKFNCPCYPHNCPKRPWRYDYDYDYEGEQTKLFILWCILGSFGGGMLWAIIEIIVTGG